MGTWMAIRWVILAHGINHEIIKLSNHVLYHGVIKTIKLLLLTTKKIQTHYFHFSNMKTLNWLKTLIHNTKEEFIKKQFEPL
jgi:hypothetical protein